MYMVYLLCQPVQSLNQQEALQSRANREILARFASKQTAPSVRKTKLQEKDSQQEEGTKSGDFNDNTLETAGKKKYPQSRSGAS
jgi:hypothetical protein